MTGKKKQLQFSDLRVQSFVPLLPEELSAALGAGITDIVNCDSSIGTNLPCCSTRQNPCDTHTVGGTELCCP